MVQHEHFKTISLGATELNIYLRLLDASVLSLHGLPLILLHEIWQTSGCSLCDVGGVVICCSFNILSVCEKLSL